MAFSPSGSIRRAISATISGVNAWTTSGMRAFSSSRVLPCCTCARPRRDSPQPPGGRGGRRCGGSRRARVRRAGPAPRCRPGSSGNTAWASGAPARRRQARLSAATAALHMKLAAKQNAVSVPATMTATTAQVPSQSGRMSHISTSSTTRAGCRCRPGRAAQRTIRRKLQRLPMIHFNSLHFVRRRIRLHGASFKRYRQFRLPRRQGFARTSNAVRTAGGARSASVYCNLEQKFQITTIPHHRCRSRRAQSGARAGVS